MLCSFVREGLRLGVRLIAHAPSPLGGVPRIPVADRIVNGTLERLRLTTDEQCGLVESARHFMRSGAGGSPEHETAFMGHNGEDSQLAGRRALRGRPFDAWVGADAGERLQKLIEATDDVGDGTGPGQLLIAILDGLPAMVSYWSPDFVNVFANVAYLEYFGVTPSEVFGKHARDVLGDALFAVNQPLMERALAGEAQVFDRDFDDASGQRRHVQASYVPYTVDGEVKGCFVLGMDLTDRVKAERAATLGVSRYRSLIHSLPGGFVLLFDTDLRLEVADGNGLPTFGYTPGQIEGRSLHDAFGEEFASFLEPRLRAALAGETTSWDREVGGRSFQLTAGPVLDEHGVVFAGTVICVDITEQRRATAIDRTLHAVSRTVASNAGLVVVAETVALGLRQVFGAEVCTLMRFTGRTRGEVIATSAPSAFESMTVEFEEFDRTASAIVAATGQPATVDFAPEPGSARLAYARGIRISSAVPIFVRGEVWGSVGIASANPSMITDEVIEALESFADLVALAIANIDAWQALTEKAERDLLTGLANRNTFDERLGLEVARSRQLGRPLVLALLDIDNFKTVNDRYGHQAGDQALVEVANRLAETVRDGETVARIGGEEFAWVLPSTTILDAWQAAERARQAVRATELDGIGTLTVSIGITQMVGPQSPEELFRDADAALYEAKRRGRDRTVRYRWDAGDGDAWINPPEGRSVDT